MDWKQIVADIQASGVSQVQIAEACGCSQATVSELATGKNCDPRASIALRVLQLHKKALRRRKDAPAVSKAVA